MLIWRRLWLALLSNELTITLVSWALPMRLLEQLQTAGYQVNEVHKGIYYVKGLVDIPIQLIVLSLLTAKQHLSLRMLTKDVLEGDARAFLQKYSKMQSC